MPTRIKSIRRWLSQCLVVQTFLGLGVVCVAVYVVTNIHLTAQQAAMMTQKIDVIRHLVAENALANDPRFLRHKLNDFFQGRPDSALIIEIDGSRERFGMKEESGPSSNERKVTFSLFGNEPQDRVTAQLILDVSPHIRLQQTLALALFMCALVGSMLVSLVSTFLVRRALAPVYELSRQVSTLSPDRMDERLDGYNQAEEIQPLVDQFNSVLGRLEKAYVQMEGFNADVAHELRNPLTTLIGETELALHLSNHDPQFAKTLESNLEELHRMARIITDMLFLSQAERGVRLHGKFVKSIAGVIMGVLEYYEAEAEEGEVKLVLNGDAEGEIERTLLQQAISNLVSNAIRYADRSSEVIVKVSTSTSETRIDVTNIGKPIEQHHLSKLFQRFYRATDERSADDNSHCGLGLAIVAAIAKMHGGKCFAECIGRSVTVGFSISNRYQNQPGAVVLYKDSSREGK